MGKFWLKSKTILFNMLTAAVAIANELAPVLHELGELGWSDQQVAAVRAAVLAINIIGNALLRTVTKEPVRLSK